MTRINVIPVEQLSSPHLASEHYEIVRVYRLVRDAVDRGEKPDDWRNPDTYRMGAGHVRFFYPRLGFIRKREIDLLLEIMFRGIPPVRELDLGEGIPPEWFGEYEPDEAARITNRARLIERNLQTEKMVMKGYFLE